MFFIPNTFVNIYRGSNLLDPDEEVDYSTAVESRIEASIIEQQSRSTPKTDTIPRTVRQATGRVISGTDVKRNDRLEDTKSGLVWVVEEFLENGNPMVKSDIKLLLSRQG